MPIRCRSKDRMEDDAFNDNCFGNDFNNNGYLSNSVDSRYLGEDDFLGNGCIGNNQTLVANHFSKFGEGQFEMDQMDVHLEKGIGAGLSWTEIETKKVVDGFGSIAIEPINGVGSKRLVFSDPNGVKVVNASSGDLDFATPRAFNDVREWGYSQI
ncbi:hypothetical protein V6N13_117775 [Hibiscus sabdariffa]|uniref:Uncharacterized protein n=1 Tax=Hibiscus sabdariffa TaxID=183260 RepID=A0ABR2QA49_9ROSI